MFVLQYVVCRVQVNIRQSIMKRPPAKPKPHVGIEYQYILIPTFHLRHFWFCLPRCSCLLARPNGSIRWRIADSDQANQASPTAGRDLQELREQRHWKLRSVDDQKVWTQEVDKNRKYMAPPNQGGRARPVGRKRREVKIIWLSGLVI